MYRISLRAEGLTQTGESFECGGRTVSINRHGAHIRLERPVPVSHKLFLTNLKNSLRGEFRVVRTLESPSGEKTDFGVEALGNYPTFWGIEFPPRPASPSESRGLLECRQCSSVTLHPLLLDEIEVLEAGGTVRKPCAACHAKTKWKFAMGISQGLLPEPFTAAGDVPTVAGENLPSMRTVFIRRPVSIRTSAGQVEIVQTENLSKDEIRCTSEKGYEINQIVTLEWENSGTGQRLQVRGRIRRRQSIAGSRRVVYSIRYEGSPAALPPVPLKPARNLYVAMGALVAAAAVLLEISIADLVSSLEFPSNTIILRVASLGMVLLLMLLAHKTWVTIRAREPESRRLFKKRHLAGVTLAGVVFLGSMGLGAIDGMGRTNQRRRTLAVLSAFATARIFEKNIDDAENRVTDNPEDYADVSSTLRLLAERWHTQLKAIDSDVRKLQHASWWPDSRLEQAMNGVKEVMAIDQRKLYLVQQQADLAAAAKTIEPGRQMAFWQSHFPPLRLKILELNAQKARVARTLVAEK